MTQDGPTQPERIDSDITPDDDVEGTTTGNPIAGVELSEDEHDRAVEPDENSALEVEGPPQKHA